MKREKVLPDQFNHKRNNRYSEELKQRQTAEGLRISPDSGSVIWHCICDCGKELIQEFTGWGIGNIEQQSPLKSPGIIWGRMIPLRKRSRNTRRQNGAIISR